MSSCGLQWTRFPELHQQTLPALLLFSLAGGYFAGRNPLWGALLVAGSLAGACLSLAPLRHRGAAVLALLLLAGAGWHGRPQAPEAPVPLGRGFRFRGAVVDDPRSGFLGPRVEVNLDAVALASGGPWRAAKGKVLLQVDGNPIPAPLRGDVAVFRARLRPARSFRNPGGEGFSAHLERKGFGARATASWPGSVMFAAPGEGAPAWLHWRRRTSAAVARQVPGQAGAVLRALTLGDRSGLSRETFESFRRAGTSHLLAISGLHLGILAILLLPLTRWVLASYRPLALAHPVEPWARTVILPVLCAYAAVSGLHTSTLRALVMAVLLLVGTALSTAVSPLALLCATGMLLALPAPVVLDEPGFHLSLAALAGLFWLAPRLEQRFRRPPAPLDRLAPEPGALVRAGRRLTSGLCGIFFAGVAATLTTTPVSVFHFGAGSLLGLVANPLAVPLVGFVCLPLGLAGVILHGLWSPASVLLWRVAGGVIDAFLALQADLGQVVPAVTWAVLRSPVGILGAACLLGWLACALEGKWRSRPAALMLAVVALSWLVLPGAEWVWGRLDPRIHLWALDVGQGQAVGLRLPGGRWVLVDGGGFVGSPFDVGEKVVVPALEALGADKLWFAVSTHPHPDHVGGLAAAIRWGRPEVLWLPAAFTGDPRYAAVLEEAGRASTRVEWVEQKRTAMRSGSATIESVWVEGPRENDRSLVLRVSTGAAAALLPGDLEIAGQRLLLETDFPLPCDVLVAPHHGAASSLYPPFLEATSPRAVMISAGGRPGLPAASFETAAGAVGARIYATHRSGCLHAWIGGPAVGVEPALR